MKGLKMKKHHLKIYFIITLLQYLAANFVHPVTPTIIHDLQLGDYMFGLAFAGMAFTNFLFSPFWGKMRDYFSCRKLLTVGCVGYAAGQYLFFIAKTAGAIMFARCFSGFFVGAISVSTMVYIMDFSRKERISQNLVVLAVIQSLGAAFGYLTGGLLGVVSIPAAFILQSSTLVLCGLLYFLFLEENADTKTKLDQPKAFFRDINPIKSFFDCGVFMTPAFALLFAAVLFSYLGSNAFDQCFNYYLKDQFGLSSAYNGSIKAIIGVITLIANSTICMWIIRKTNLQKSSSYVLTACGISIFTMLTFPSLILFIVTALIFFTFNAIFIPLLQSLVAGRTKEHANLVMGFYNAVKSLGLVGGALIAGLIYGFGKTLPFIFAGICFLISAFFLRVKKK